MKTKSKISLALLCGILGSLCFGVGDWLLGYVDSTPIGENIFYCVYVFVAAALFTPAIPMGIIATVSGVLLTSPFAYGLSTFCMNGGLIVWFVYLLIHQDTAVEDCDDEF